MEKEKEKTLHLQQKDRVLFVGLDSPNSPVNIMTRSTAGEISALFDRLSPNEVELVVFHSRKPYSFLNGAELLLTNHISNESDLKRLTDVTREAYEKVLASPIPTLAAIEGNCFGCGMEFTLCCDYRLAADSHDTRFYMTELKDYHCLPVFGGLQRLPRLVGLDCAVDLLIKGQTWSARKALEKGLVDGLYDDLSTGVNALLKKGVQKKQWPPFSFLKNTTELPIQYYQKIKAEVGLLPPIRQSLYQECLDLVFESYSEKIAASSADASFSASSFSQTASRSATSFFFIRTMARFSSIGTTSTLPAKSSRIRVIQKDHPFGHILLSRNLKNLDVRWEIPRKGEEKICFVLEDGEKQYPVETVWGYQEDLKDSPETLLYFPLGEEADVCEIFLEPPHDEIFKPFLISLFHMGWTPFVVKSPFAWRSSPINRFLWKYLEAVAVFHLEGGNSQHLNRTLWEFGFDHLPIDLIRKLGKPQPANLSGEWENGAFDPELLKKILEPLQEEGASLLQEGLLRHTSQIDFILRSIFGYPLVRDHFSRFLATRAKESSQDMSAARVS